jgi:hypothetical protein
MSTEFLIALMFAIAISGIVCVTLPDLRTHRAERRARRQRCAERGHPGMRRGYVLNDPAFPIDYCPSCKAQQPVRLFRCPHCAGAIGYGGRKLHDEQPPSRRPIPIRRFPR